VQVGHRALEYLASLAESGSGELPAIVLVDVETAGTVAPAILVRIKSDARLRRIRVLMVVDSPGERPRGADGYLLKTTNADSLIETISEHLNRPAAGIARRPGRGEVAPVEPGCAGEVRVLLVWHDLEQRRLIVQALTDETGRYHVTQVTTGKECLEQPLERFDVVLASCELPDMNGLDLLDRIKSQFDLPVVLVTDRGDKALVEESIRRGAEDGVVRASDYATALSIVLDKSIKHYRLLREKSRIEGELQQMLIQLEIKNAQLEQSLEQLEWMAATDYLTGLPNRRCLNDRLRGIYDQAVRYGFDLSCCMCDLDGYKQLNDTYGHKVGDEILVATADVIRSGIRSSDLAARYGGDEFVLLLLHASIPAARAICERIGREIAKATAGREKLSSSLTMSIGIVSLRQDRPSDPETMLHMADVALYAAKQRGGNRIVLYSTLGPEDK